MEPMLITASPNSPLIVKFCDDCENTLLAASTDKFCGICGGKDFSNLKQASAAMTASVHKPQDLGLYCGDCKSKIYSSVDDDAYEAAQTTYCVVCGSTEVEVDEDVDLDKGPLDTEDDVEEDVKEKLESVDLDTMEATLLSSPQDNWMLFHGGTPIIRLKKSIQAVDSKMFSSPTFFTAFKNRAGEIGLLAATKEFGGEILDHHKVIQNNDVEKMVYDRMQATVLPKLLDCINIAIEGAVKNVYPELNTELKAEFFNELSARNIPDPMTVVESAFQSCGTKVFTGIVAKAMQLYNKAEPIREELKSTILATPGVKSDQVQEADIDSVEIAAKLENGNFPLKDTFQPVAASALNDMRSRLKLGNRR